MFLKITICLTIIYVVTSCGLRYEAPETSESFKKRRQEAVSNYISNEYTKLGIGYESIVFGTPTVQKTRSYEVLDSLYTIKYNNEKKGIHDEKLENNIQLQKILIAEDTSTVYYIERHVYRTIEADSSNIYFADVKLNKQAEVVNFTLTDDLKIANALAPMYKLYLTEASFIDPYFAPTNSEIKLIELFKSKENTLTGEARDKFVDHTLKVLTTARYLRTTNKELLIKDLVIQHDRGRHYSPNKDIFRSVDVLLKDNEITNYVVVFSSDRLFSRTALLSPYFEIIEIN